MVVSKKAMATPRMNDPTWVAGLVRARATTKYEFVAIHVLAPLRNHEGVAPVVLQTQGEYWRAPAPMEAAFELCLRHLNRLSITWPEQSHVTPQALLANRAMEALKLPGKYVPTAAGKVIVMEETSCHVAGQVGPMQEASAAATMGSPNNGAEQIATQPDATTAAEESEDGQNVLELQNKTMESPIVDKPEGEAEQAAAEPSDVGQSESEVERASALPPDANQPSGEARQATAESPTADQPQGEVEHATAGLPAKSEGEAEQAGAKPSTTDPSDGEAEHAGADPSSADPTDGDAVAREARTPLSTLSKKARRRAAQKARKRGR